jgi:hypothetical protein
MLLLTPPLLPLLLYVAQQNREMQPTPTSKHHNMNAPAASPFPSSGLYSLRQLSAFRDGVGLLQELPWLISMMMMVMMIAMMMTMTTTIMIMTTMMTIVIMVMMQY